MWYGRPKIAHTHTVQRSLGSLLLPVLHNFTRHMTSKERIVRQHHGNKINVSSLNYPPPPPPPPPPDSSIKKVF